MLKNSVSPINSLTPFFSISIFLKVFITILEMLPYLTVFSIVAQELLKVN
jgi:hypothetical protein